MDFKDANELKNNLLNPDSNYVFQLANELIGKEPDKNKVRAFGTLVLAFFEAHNSGLLIVKKAISYEVENNTATVLFRELSLATVLAVEYVTDLTGKSHLRNLLLPYIDQWKSFDPSWKVEGKLALEECEGDEKKNLEMLLNSCQSLFDQLCSSVKTFPLRFRETMAYLYNQLQIKQPDDEPDFPIKRLGSFFFLYFINPNIVNPSLFVTSETITPHARRVFIWAAKLLQSLAVWKSPSPATDSFVARNLPPLQKFLLEMVDTSTFPAEQATIEDDSAAIHEKRVLALSELGYYLKVNQQGGVKRNQKDEKIIVVIGGGFAGSFICKKLEQEKKFQVILIDRKDYFENSTSVLRILCDPNMASQMQIPHTSYLQRTSVILGDVKYVTPDSVILENNEVIEFDYLVITSGSHYNSGIKQKHTLCAFRLDRLAEEADVVKSAKKIIIVGGGVVGCELAGEIICTFPDKEVTIIHDKEVLIERCPPKSQKIVEKFLRKRGVNFIFGERVINTQEHSILTGNGTTIHADKIFFCSGPKPTSHFMNKYFSKQLDKEKRILVDQYLRLPDFPNIFSGGDVAALSEERTAERAMKHASIICTNIKKTIDQKSLVKYEVPKVPPVILISMGPKNAVLMSSGMVLSSGQTAAKLKTYLFYYTLKQLQTVSSKNAPKATNQSSSFAKAKKSSANLGTSSNLSSSLEKSKKIILILTATTVAYAIVQQFAFSTLIDEITLRVVVFSPVTSIEKRRFSKMRTLAEVLEVDINNPQQVDSAFSGVHSVFLTSPTGPSMVRDTEILVTAAKKAGVSFLLKSHQGGPVIGSDSQPITDWLAQSEKVAQNAGLPSVMFIRHTNFFDNILLYHGDPVFLQGLLIMPLGNRPVTWMDPRDVASVSLKILTDSSLQKNGEIITLTGSELLTGEQMASIMSTVVGAEIIYQDMPQETVENYFSDIGFTAQMAQAMSQFYRVEKTGVQSIINNEIEKITGKIPISFEQWVEANEDKIVSR